MNINGDTGEDDGVETMLESNEFNFDKFNTEPVQEVASKRELIMITLPIVAWAFVRTIVGIFTAPFFLSFGLDAYILPWILLAGPISGILAQPIIGAVSDNWRSRWGKRKPFIAIGTIGTAISLEFFAFSDFFGTLLGDTQQSMAAGLVFAIISFWILDLALSIIQPAIIALMTDRASAEQQKTGNGFTASFASLGSILAGLLAGKIPHVSFSIMVIFPFMGNEIRAIATLGSFVLVLCSTLCFIYVKEQSTEHMAKKNTTFLRTLKEVALALPNLPRRMKRNYIVTLFGYFGFSTWIFYSSTWYGIYIAGGDPSAPVGSELRNKYHEGAMMSALGGAVGGVFSFFYAPLFIFLMRFGVKPMYCFTCASIALTFFATLFVRSFPIALIISSLMSANTIALFIAPWTINAVCAQNVPSKKGLYLATSATSLYISQLINSGTASIILKIFNSFEAVFIFGGIISGIGAVLALFVIRNDYDKTSSVDDDPREFIDPNTEMSASIDFETA
jgi:Na+/melibiose symporter-like transporter